jgi:tripartite-type tricarboxylate transporter receptor subunit TctC
MQRIFRFAAAGIAAVMIGVAPIASLAQADDYPVKPVRIIVPFAPGGSTDQLARLVAERLTHAWNRQFVVENRAGAGGNIGAGVVATAEPDGHTLVMGSIGTHATNSLIYPKMPYETVADFAPVTQVANVPLILVVHPSLEAKSVSELVALLKAKPGQLNYASGGNGASQHLAGELFKFLTGTDVQHVPYKGSAASLPDLLAGRMTFMFADLPLVLPYVKDGKLRALAIAGRNRIAQLPDVPTVAESGVKDYEASAWYALFAPAKTPAAIIDKLQVAIAKELRTPEAQRRLDTMGVEPVLGTPADLHRFQASEIARWSEVVKAAKIRID